MNSFPPSWVAVKLGDICEIERGVTFPSDAQASEPSEKHIVCLRTTNVQERVEWEDLIYIPRSYAQDENKQVRQNDILISIANSKELVGKVACVEKVEIEALFGGFISIIRATDLIDPYYLYSFLRATSTQEKLRSVSNQTTNIANLTVKEINRFPIPLPPLPEQRRIADVLHKADALHQWRHNANDKYEELLRALFIQMFGDPYTNPKGWEIVSVESLKHPNKPVIRTGPFGSSLKKHEYTQQGIPVWGIDNVKPNAFVEQNSLFVSATKFLQLRNYEVNDGDVLISRAGTTGRMCVAHPKQSPSIIGTNLIRLSLDQEKILP
jgi:type I restriction enzyme, S subunit